MLVSAWTKLWWPGCSHDLLLGNLRGVPPGGVPLAKFFGCNELVKMTRLKYCIYWVYE